jgi:peptidase M48-like protein
MVNLVSRQQEYRADELACLVAGRQPLIDGLRAINGAAMAWPTYWNTEVSPVLSDGSLPAVADGFRRFVSAPGIARQIEQKLEEAVQKPQQNPYDTHPPLPSRIAALERMPEALDAPDARPALCLLNDLPATELSFVQDRIPDLRARALNYVSWDDITLRVTIPAWQKAVQTHATVLRGVTTDLLLDQIPKLREIGSDIPDPKGMLLTAAQRTQRAARLFAAALALMLVQSGWTVQVQPGVFHMRRGDLELNPFLVLDQMLNGKISREAWLAQCRELGISGLSLLPPDMNTNGHESAASTQAPLF